MELSLQKVNDLYLSHLLSNRYLLPCHLSPDDLWPGGEDCPSPSSLCISTPLWFPGFVSSKSQDFIFFVWAYWKWPFSQNDPGVFNFLMWDLGCWRSYLPNPCGWLWAYSLADHNLHNFNFKQLHAPNIPSVVSSIYIFTLILVLSALSLI